MYISKAKLILSFSPSSWMGKHLIKEKPAETTTASLYISSIFFFFFPQSLAPSGGKWNRFETIESLPRFEDPWNPSSRRLFPPLLLLIPFDLSLQRP